MIQVKVGSLAFPSWEPGCLLSSTRLVHSWVRSVTRSLEGQKRGSREKGVHLWAPGTWDRAVVPKSCLPLLLWSLVGLS